MNPKQMAAIIRDSENDFNKWYEENKNECKAERDELLSCYLAASASMVAQISAATNDKLYRCKEDEPDIPEGKGLENFIQDICSRVSEQMYNDRLKIKDETVTQFFDENDEMIKNFALTILSCYIDKPDLGFDEDDGIEGEEADARHEALNNLFLALPAIKNGILKKDGMVRTLHGLADFIDQNL